MNQNSREWIKTAGSESNSREWIKTIKEWIKIAESVSKQQGVIQNSRECVKKPGSESKQQKVNQNCREWVKTAGVNQNLRDESKQQGVNQNSKEWIKTAGSVSVCQSKQQRVSQWVSESMFYKVIYSRKFSEHCRIYPRSSEWWVMASLQSFLASCHKILALKSFAVELLKLWNIFYLFFLPGSISLMRCTCVNRWNRTEVNDWTMSVPMSGSPLMAAIGPMWTVVSDSTPSTARPQFLWVVNSLEWI